MHVESMALPADSQIVRFSGASVAVCVVRLVDRIKLEISILTLQYAEI